MENKIVIQEDLIKPGTKARPGEHHLKKWIVVHETDNFKPTAGAKNHATFIKRLAEENQRFLSWHYTVDDTNIIQHIPDNEIAWHAGDGRKTNGGNMCGIGIEICVNSGSKFRIAVRNTAKLVAFLMKKYSMATNQIKQHNYFSGKNCPAVIRKYGFWDTFLLMCSNELKALNR